MCPPADPSYPFEVEGDTPMVVLLGIDVHKGTHTAVAVDEIGQCVVAATDGGHRQLLGWALSRWSGDRLRFAVEDCR